jgi:SAM-dependent methyltransferase
MPWEYLRDPELDGRLLVVAGYLTRWITGKTILDLDCGYAPLLKFLPRTFNEYVGNDTDPEAIAFLKENYPVGKWFECRDDELPKLERVDVLLCLGYGAHLNRYESATLDETVMALVYEHYPEIIVLEVWTRYPLLNEFNDLVDWIAEQDYEEVGMWWVRPWQQASGIYADRGVVFLERRK